MGRKLAGSERTVMAKQVIEQTNIRVLHPSRKQVRVGDVFVVQMPDGLFTFGRVVDKDLSIGPMPNNILIYFFKHRSVAKNVPDRRFLKADQLLRGPIFINQLPWSRGYFETVGNVPLEKGDRLEKDCFWDAIKQKYVDLGGKPIRNPVEPCGEYGLSSYRTVDDKLSKALGFPLAPD